MAGAVLAAIAGCAAADDPPRSAAAAAADAGTASSTDQLVTNARLVPCPPVSPAARPRTGLPSVSLPCLGVGPRVTLAGVRGPAVVNLWASWCRPCRVEMPRLQALQARAGSRLLVLGVASDDERRNALSAAAAIGVRYASVLDTKGSVRRSYGYPALPITLFLDRSGAVAHRIIGPVPPLPELVATVSSKLGVRL